MVSAFGGYRRCCQSPHDDDCELGRIRARLGRDETPVDGTDNNRCWVEVHGVCVWMPVCGNTGHVRVPGGRTTAGRGAEVLSGISVHEACPAPSIGSRSICYDMIHDATRSIAFAMESSTSSIYRCNRPAQDPPDLRPLYPVGPVLVERCSERIRLGPTAIRSLSRSGILVLVHVLEDLR